MNGVEVHDMLCILANTEAKRFQKKNMEDFWFTEDKQLKIYVDEVVNTMDVDHINFPLKYG